MTLPSACKKCEAPLASNAVICTNCGTHVRSGLDVRTVQSAKRVADGGKAIGKTFLAIAVASLVSIVGAMVFAFLMTLFGEFAVRYLPLLAGGAIGLTGGGVFAAFFHQRRILLGLLACVPAAFGLLIALLLTAHWSIGRWAELIADDDDMVTLVYFNLKYKTATGHDGVEITSAESDSIGFRIKPGVFLDTPADVDLDQLVSAAEAETQNSDGGKQARAVEAFLKTRWSYADRVRSELNFLNIIAGVIALVLAFLLGRGSIGSSFAD